MSVPIEVVFINGGVFTTLLMVLAFFLRKWITSIDERLKDICLKLAVKVPESTCIERRSVIMKEIDDVCKEKEKDHEDIWDKLHHHKHTATGQFVDTTAKG